MVQTEARNASLNDLANLLKEQHASKLDVVAGAGAIRSLQGAIYLKGVDAEIDLDGVTPTEAAFQPTTVFDEGVADKLGIPLPYVRRLRAEFPTLLDSNVNGWLERDGRSFLVRCFRGGDGGVGIARALLSDRFKVMDNLDVLMAGLDGVKQANVEVDIIRCDLSERQMHVVVSAPDVVAYAPQFLANYRSPFDGARGADDPRVAAGFKISNSETGGGAFSIVPWIQVKVCSNGMTVERDIMRNVHLGGRMEEGVIRWSEETMAKTLELVTSRTKDAVATFLDVDYVSKAVAWIEERSEKPVEKPVETIQTIGKKLAFTDQAQAHILDHFIKGGDTSAGGLVNAVTSYAQTVESPDAANELEAVALRVLDLV
jgi:hypothetical protein